MGKTSLEVDEKTYWMLAELFNSVKILQDYLNDQVIQDLSKILNTLFKLINAVSSTDLVDLLERSLQDPELDRALLEPPRIGLVGLLKALKDEEVQRGLGILIKLLKALGKTSAHQKASNS